MWRKSLICQWLVGLSLILLAWPASAVVNLKNGNYYIAYHDLVVDEDSGLKISRHYNSLSANKGWFGWGWGTEYETRLVVMPDGLVAVRENGNAHVTIYGEATRAQTLVAADQILAQLRKKGLVRAHQEAATRQKLSEDPLLRLYWTERFALSGSPAKVGTRMKGQEFRNPLDSLASKTDTDLVMMAFATGDRNMTLLKLKTAYLAIKEKACGYLLRTPQGYERGTCSNERFADQQFFDNQGRLTQLNTKNDMLSIAYDKGPNPSRIVDESGNAIDLKWHSNGLLAQIGAMVNGKRRETDFTYDDVGHLIKSDAHTANVYRYEYDANHHLTRITYSNDTRKDLEYDDRGRVVRITEPDGRQALFQYTEDAQGVSEAVYSIRFVSGTVREFRRVRYNTKGNVLLDREGPQLIEVEYHPTHGTVTRLRTNRVDCRYEYDDAGKLKSEDCPSTNERNTFDYDSQGRMSKVVLSVPAGMQERLKTTFLTLTIQRDHLGRLTRIGEPQSPVFATTRYLNDEDTNGAVEINGIPEDDMQARFLFGYKANILDRALKSVQNRTRVNSGFVMVTDMP